MPDKIRLVVCHQNTLLRECVASALSGTETMDAVALDGGQAEGMPLGDELPDVLIIDANLPNTGAFRLVESLSTRSRRPRIIFLVSSSIPELLESCLLAGADGCVIDDDTLDDLRQAIAIVLSGRNYCSPEVARRLFSVTHAAHLAHPSSRLDGRAQKARLTPREIEILGLIARRDLSNKQIARELRVSVYTVKNHVHSIIEKLCVDGRLAAVRFAARQGLLHETSA